MKGFEIIAEIRVFVKHEGVLAGWLNAQRRSLASCSSNTNNN